MSEEEPTRIPIDYDSDVEYGRLTTPVSRHPEPEQDFEADCPVHGTGLFQYNAPMNAFFCPHYHWGSEESFIRDECCDSVVLVADMMEDPDGGPVRHRGTMEKVTEEEYQVGEMVRLAKAGGKTADLTKIARRGLDEKFRLTTRKEPTPPPGMKKTVSTESSPPENYFQ